MRHAASLLLVCLLGSTHAPAWAQTLPEAVASALERFPDFRSVLANRRAAGELVEQARGGLLPSLDLQTLTLGPLEQGARYSLVPEAGLVASREQDQRGSLSGAQWRALQQGPDPRPPFQAPLRQAAPVMAELKPQLRTLLHYHCGVTTLRTRQLMIDLQAL